MAGLLEAKGAVIDPAPARFGPAALVTTAIVIGGLYLTRDVLVPVVFAILLSFVLAIPARLLQRLGLGRKLAVTAVVLAGFGIIGLLGTILASQMTELAGELPRYQSTIREKLASLKGGAGAGPLDRLIHMGEDLSREIAKENTAGSASASGAAPAKPIQVEVAEPSGPMKTLGNIVAPVLKPVATGGLVVVFTVFILLQRADIRNRAIRLAGSGDLQRTTGAMDDAARRLSKFFLAQVLLNAAFGAVVGIGLWFLGIPNPVLWGILAAISKFVPYFGVVIAAGGPLLLAAAIDPTWVTFLIAAGFFAVSEFLVGQVIEPLVYGHSTGLSPVAVILSVTFWTWLWGPVGLILATPLTVCLVVLGRHVERLRFLDVMLGDRPPLTTHESFYQRSLAGDTAEMIDQAEEFLKEHRLATFYDEVALRSLGLAEADLGRGSLGEPQLDRIASSMDHMIEELAEHEEDEDPVDEWLPEHAEPGLSAEEAEERARLHMADREASQLPQAGPDVRRDCAEEAPVLCIAARTELDRIAAGMLAQLLSKSGLGARAESAHALTAAGAERLARPGVRIVCLSSLDATTPAHLRHAIRRLRRRMPQARILLGIWGLDPAKASAWEAENLADGCAARFVEAARFCLDDEVARRETIGPVAGGPDEPLRVAGS